MLSIACASADLRQLYLRYIQLESKYDLNEISSINVAFIFASYFCVLSGLLYDKLQVYITIIISTFLSILPLLYYWAETNVEWVPSNAAITGLFSLLQGAGAAGFFSVRRWTIDGEL